MKTLKKIETMERGIESLIALQGKKLGSLERTLRKLRLKYPFRCKKCRTAFGVEESRYKTYQSIVQRQECQPMGDYDIWQETQLEKHICCPKCGAKVGEFLAEDPEFISMTQKYGRWDGRKITDFQPCGTKCVDKKPRKLNKRQVEYVKSQLDPS